MPTTPPKSKPPRKKKLPSEPPKPPCLATAQEKLGILSRRFEDRSKAQRAYSWRRVQKSGQVAPGYLLDYLPVDAYLYRPPLHSSAAKEWFICPRKFFFTQRLGLRLRGMPSRALEIGTWFHRARALLHLGAQSAQVRSVCRASFDLWSHQQEEQNAPSGVFADGTIIKQFRETTTTDFEKALAMAFAFNQIYPGQTGRWLVKAVEEEVVFQWDSIPVPISARLDLVVQDRETGDLWIIDDKTTAKPPAVLAPAGRIDLAKSMYRLGAMTLFPRDRVVGMIHSYCQKPGIKLCAKDDHDPENYLHRVRDWLEERQPRPELSRTLQTESRFSTRTFMPSDHLETLRRLSLLLKSKIDLDDYPRCSNLYTCGGFGQLPPCSFLPLCGHEKPTTEWLHLLSEQGIYVQDHRDFGPNGAPKEEHEYLVPNWVLSDKQLPRPLRDFLRRQGLPTKQDCQDELSNRQPQE